MGDRVNHQQRLERSAERVEHHATDSEVDAIADTDLLKNATRECKSALLTSHSRARNAEDLHDQRFIGRSGRLQEPA